MNKRDKFQIIKHGLAMLSLWKIIINESKIAIFQPDWRKGRCSSWYKHDAKQAYQDAMNSLKSLGFIQSYDVINTKIQIDDVWYGYDDIPKRYQMRFKQTGKPIEVIF